MTLCSLHSHPLLFSFFLNSLNRLFKSAFLATFPVTLDAATAFFLSLTAFFRWSADSFFFRSNSCNDKPSIPRSDFNVLLFLLFLPELKMDSFLCALLHTFFHHDEQSSLHVQDRSSLLKIHMRLS